MYEIVFRKKSCAVTRLSENIAFEPFSSCLCPRIWFPNMSFCTYVGTHFEMSDMHSLCSSLNLSLFPCSLSRKIEVDSTYGQYVGRTIPTTIVLWYLLCLYSLIKFLFIFFAFFLSRRSSSTTVVIVVVNFVDFDHVERGNLKSPPS